MNINTFVKILFKNRKKLAKCILLLKSNFALRIVILTYIILIPGYIFSQFTTIDSLKYWSLKAENNINISQGVVSNWVEGGENFVSLLGVSKLQANYKNDDVIWSNSAEIRYGLNILNDLTKANKIDLRKTDDRILIETTYGKKFYKNWYLSIMGNMKTQFSEGYNYPNDSIPVSDFMSPAKFYLAFGFENKPHEGFNLLLSPLTIKTTIVANKAVDETHFGIKEGERIDRQIGPYIKLMYKKKIMDNIIMDNKLSVFSNYLDHPLNLDIDYQIDLTMKINKYFQTTIHLHFLYDDNIDVPVYNYTSGKKVQVGTTKKLQFKEILTFGFIYTFSNNKE